DLDVGRGKAHLHRVGVAQQAVVLDAGALERLLDQLFGLLVDLEGCLEARDLHRRRFAVEIRQRVDQPEQQGHQHYAVAPEGISVHGVGLGLARTTAVTDEGMDSRSGKTLPAGCFRPPRGMGRVGRYLPRLPGPPSVPELSGDAKVWRMI